MNNRKKAAAGSSKGMRPLEVPQRREREKIREKKREAENDMGTRMLDGHREMAPNEMRPRQER